MSNDLVVQLGSKLDQFQSDMNQAGDIADGAVGRIESSFSNLNPGLGGFSGIGAIFTGATASVGVLLAALQNINGELAAISKNAEFVGVSVERFQQLQFAATQSGIGSDQATTDLRKVASLLADAKENENSLTKLLETNNVKFKDRNGDVVKLNEFLKIAADLIDRFRSLPEKVKAAEALGLSEQWVNSLKGGGKAFEAIAQSADEAGAVIDKSTIAKAEAFDIAWKKSTALLGSQFRAIAGEIAGVLDDLINKASDFITALAAARGAAPGSGQERFNAIADALDVARKDAQGLGQDVEQVNKVLERYQKLGSADSGIVAGLEEARDKAKQVQDQATLTGNALKSAFSKQNFPGGVPLPGARPGDANAPQDTDAKLASRKKDSGARDQFEITADSITKRTATINADTAATFQNNAVQAQFRAEFQLLTSIMRDNGEVTQKQIDTYEKLRQTMSAQQALTAAGITLTDAHSAAFLSSSNNIKTATAAYDQARDSLNKINSASSQLGSALSTAFADAVVEGKSLNDVLSSLVKTLEKAAINSLFASFFNPGVGGGVSSFSKLLGFGTNAEGTDNWRGGPTWVGEKGPEIVNLPRGAQVVPNAVAARSTSGGTSISYEINAAGADSGTVARIQYVLQQHAKAITGVNKSLVSAQRMQSSGVG